jgi:predicted dehydrogenase
MPVHTLIVGLGQIGMGYDLELDPESHVLTHARAFSRHPAFQLEGGVDVDADRRRTFEARYECPSFSGLEAALEATRPELVVVAVPTQLHTETLRMVLHTSRPTAILCEKPLSYDVADARAMVEECERANALLFVNYVRRADPGAVEVKRRIVSGQIGSPVKGVVWYSKGFLHNGSHFFNLLQDWLGAVQTAQIVTSGRSWDGTDSEPDVRVTFARGPVLFLAAKEEEFSHYTIELLAPNGRLRYERGGSAIDWQQAMPHPTFRGQFNLSAQAERIPSGMDRYQWHVAEELAGALAGRDHHLCSAREALSTLEQMQHILDKR